MKNILEFYKWFEEIAPATLETELVDSKGIEGIYNKANKAVEIVRKYDAAGSEHNWLKSTLDLPKNKPFGYLRNISTISSLAGNNYGLFVSTEDKRLIDADLIKGDAGPKQSSLPITFKSNQEISQEDIARTEFLKNMAFDVVKRKFPDIDLGKIHSSATIHVNVQKIVNDIKKLFAGKQDAKSLIEMDKKIIEEIASTIVHESTHQLEFRKKGSSTESLPKMAQEKFKSWLQRNPKILDVVTQG